MAIIEPPIDTTQSPAHAGEFDTLMWLEAALPDEFTVFHSVEWLRRYEHSASIGEVDFCVIGPSGKLLLIEQKNGALSLNDSGDLIKQYSSSEKNPYKQLQRSVYSLQGLWRKFHDRPLAINLLVYLPDYQVTNRACLSFDSDCLVDAGNKHSLPGIIQATLAESEEPTDFGGSVDDLHLFLSQQFELSFDVGYMMESQQRHYCHYNDGVVRTLKQLEYTPAYLLVDGPAGSGKTQIAVDLYAHFISQQKRPLYICFNRPLAEAISAFAMPGGTVSNIDRFTDLYMKDRAIYDFEAQNLGKQLVGLRELANKAPIAEEWLVDALIIDEAQDIKEEQFGFLQRFLRPGATVVVLRDEAQNLYAGGFEFKETLKLNLQGNYRCSKEIVAFTNQLLAIEGEVAEGVTTGLPGNIQTYSDIDDQIRLITEIINSYLARGFSLADIAIVSGLGKNRSCLAELNEISGIPLKRFTGEYSADGMQIYTEGELELDNVYRFKGRQKPAIIFTELEFEEWSEKVQRLIYCGCTRARLELSVLMSEQAGNCVLARMQV